MNKVIVEVGLLRKKFCADSGRINTLTGDRVLLSDKDGLGTGMVIASGEDIDEKPVWKIVRKLKKEDYKILKDNELAAESKDNAVKEEIAKEGLGMKLVALRYSYGRSKLYVYYTAEGRVDFRQLIRNLGSRLKVRIQMVQIGVRDEASIMGGIGLCGREVCCCRFLRNIEAVNIDMARKQNIIQNSDNISGCCGRLLCCLHFENRLYSKKEERLPDKGQKVNTVKGKAQVLELNKETNKIKVKFKNGEVEELDRKDISCGMKERLKKWIK
ncbi:MAG: PSP1 domain-containing protein [Elusimicrobiota bacterium]